MRTGGPQTDAGVMTHTDSLTAGLAHAHIDELLRQAATARAVAELPARNGHRTPRRRPLWWVRTADSTSTTPRAA